MICLSSAYLAPIEYYRLLCSGEEIVIEAYDHYVKQSYRNRCRIATANGVQTLSIPIEKPASPKSYTKDIRIAEHGNWQHLHWHAIVSAYNSTPFFEFLEDDFRPFYEKQYDFLIDFNEELRQLICGILDIQVRISCSTCYKTDFAAGEIDLRDAIHPKKEPLSQDFKPYYQVFDTRYGFQPNLSIIDLLFNMGTEALLYLEELT